MITLPPIPSRTIRLGEPTSSGPSGVIVAALRPSPASRMAAAASSTTWLDVARRFSRPRSKCVSPTGSPRTSLSSTRKDCSSSSWPVSSPSSATISIRSAMHRKLASAAARCAQAEIHNSAALIPTVAPSQVSGRPRGRCRRKELLWLDWSLAAGELQEPWWGLPSWRCR